MQRQSERLRAKGEGIRDSSFILHPSALFTHSPLGASAADELMGQLQDLLGGDLPEQTAIRIARKLYLVADNIAGLACLLKKRVAIDGFGPCLAYEFDPAQMRPGENYVGRLSRATKQRPGVLRPSSLSLHPSVEAEVNHEA